VFIFLAYYLTFHRPINEMYK